MMKERSAGRTNDHHELLGEDDMISPSRRDEWRVGSLGHRELIYLSHKIRRRVE